MMRGPIAVVVAVAATLAACKKSGEPIVAQLEQITAQVERMPKAAAPWQPGRVGDTFVIGSGVRTGAASRAKLRVGKRGKLDVEPSSIVYFTRMPGRTRDGVRVETGIVELESGDEPIGIGDAVLDPNSRARIEASASDTTIVVAVGRAILEDTEIAAGQRITIGPAGAVATTTAPPADAATAPPADGKTTIAVRDKPVRVSTSSGDRELAVGEHAIEPGTTVVVPAGGVVEVARDGARATAGGPAKLRVGDGAVLVDVSTGSVALDARAADAVASVPGGTVTANRGGAATITAAASETAVDAQRGTTVVETARGKQTLDAGQSALVRSTGELVVAPPPPARTVVSIAAGESPTIHDPRAPTPIRVAFDAVCPAGGVVELARDRAFKKLVARSGGSGSANVLVAVGSYSYRVRCPGGRGASGALRVAKDSGRTPLPKTAARTTVDMDGREYTILFQNVLPDLQLSWRTAPRGTSYTFVVEPARGAAKRIPSASPTVTLPSGELREGRYKVWVEPASGKRSEESRIVIEFDNAAQSASIDVVESVAGAAGKVRVKGTVIESSAVSANGSAIPLDRHRRFDTELVAPDGADGVGVRIAHPKAGIHYYVMRTAAP